MNIFDSLKTALGMNYHGLGLMISDIKYWKIGRRTNRQDSEDDTEDISNQVVVITGGGRGLGKASAFEFAKRNATVVIGCRKVEEGLKTAEEIQVKTGNKNIEVVFLDLSDMDSVAEFASQVGQKYASIKILVNNSGVVEMDNGKQAKTKDGFCYVMTVNHFGHFLLTNLLLDNLKRAAPSRVIILTSHLQLSQHLDFKNLNNNYIGRLGLQEHMPYCNSKYANSLFAKELANRLQGTGVSTYSLCPGTVYTTIMDNGSFKGRLYFQFYLLLSGISAEQAASEFIVYQALSKKVASESGSMYRNRKLYKAANRKLKDDIAKELWETTADLVKLDDRLQQKKSRTSSSSS